MNKRFLGFVGASVFVVSLFAPIGVPAAATPVSSKQVTDDFIEALTVVESNYASDVDYARLSKAAIGGMLQALDPHSHFYDTDEYEAFQTDQQSQYFGIGATIGERNGKVFILAPFPGTPAEIGRAHV